MKKYLFFIDAESDGLYGSFLTVGIYVLSDTGEEVERAYYGIRRDHMHVTEPWVEEHVLPILGEYEECEDEEELLEKVWKLWEKYQGDAYAIADVPYPVECRLFEQCVQKDLQGRMHLAPFPLLDVSSILWANGMNPLVNRTDLLKNVPGEQHNALTDAVLSAEIVRNIREGKKRC